MPPPQKKTLSPPTLLIPKIRVIYTLHLRTKKIPEVFLHTLLYFLWVPSQTLERQTLGTTTPIERQILDTINPRPD